jgi:hypothetical protein
VNVVLPKATSYSCAFNSVPLKSQYGSHANVCLEAAVEPFELSHPCIQKFKSAYISRLTGGF